MLNYQIKILWQPNSFIVSFLHTDKWIVLKFLEAIFQRRKNETTNDNNSWCVGVQNGNLYKVLLQVKKRETFNKYEKREKHIQRNNPVDTRRKLNVHKTFRRRPGRLLNSYVHSIYVLCLLGSRPSENARGVFRLKRLKINTA